MVYASRQKDGVFVVQWSNSSMRSNVGDFKMSRRDYWVSFPLSNWELNLVGPVGLIWFHGYRHLQLTCKFTALGVAVSRGKLMATKIIPDHGYANPSCLVEIPPWRKENSNAAYYCLVGYWPVLQLQVKLIKDSWFSLYLYRKFVCESVSKSYFFLPSLTNYIKS